MCAIMQLNQHVLHYQDCEVAVVATAVSVYYERCTCSPLCPGDILCSSSRGCCLRLGRKSAVFPEVPCTYVCDVPCMYVCNVPLYIRVPT